MGINLVSNYNYCTIQRLIDLLKKDNKPIVIDIDTNDHFDEIIDRLIFFNMNEMEPFNKTNINRIKLVCMETNETHEFEID